MVWSLCHGKPTKENIRWKTKPNISDNYYICSCINIGIFIIVCSKIVFNWHTCGCVLLLNIWNLENVSSQVANFCFSSECGIEIVFFNGANCTISSQKNHKTTKPQNSCAVSKLYFELNFCNAVRVHDWAFACLSGHNCSHSRQFPFVIWLKVKILQRWWQKMKISSRLVKSENLTEMIMKSKSENLT